jgi:hypothetical protein
MLLPEPQKHEFRCNHPNAAQYDLPNFRKDVVAWLGNQYGGDLDTSGTKALRIKPGGNRRSADILLVCPHKRYLSPRAEDQTVVEGVIFQNVDGKTIINYPKQHSDNLTAKNRTTNTWLKPTVRVYKNMRNRLVEKGFINTGTAPSYFLEGLLYNVPREQFGSSWVGTVESTVAWIEGNAPADYTCANGIHPLIRENTATSWPAQGYIDWLNPMKKLWNTWQ